MSLITNIIGGIMGAHAAGQAANAQVGAAQEAANTVQNAAATGNQGIQSATSAGQNQVLAAGQTAGQGVTLASVLAQLGVNNATATGQSGVTGAAQTGQVNLNPYASAGSGAAAQLAAGLAPGGNLAQQFNGVTFENSPQYQFQLQQGQQALQRQLAATGGIEGGGALKQLNAYSQGVASQAYQQAFNNFQTQQQNAIGNLQNLANAGQAAATSQGQFGLQGATTAANLGLAGSEYSGNVGLGGAEYAGNTGIQTNQYAASLGYQSAAQQAQNANIAAQFAGNTQLQAGNARAAGITGKQNSYNNLLSAVGSFGNDATIGLGKIYGLF